MKKLMITMVAVMIAIAANAQYNQIRMVTPLRLIVIDMVIPQEQTGAIRIVSETPLQLIQILMAKEKVHQAPILTATETLPRPIRTVMDKALALPPAIRIRLGIPLLSSVTMLCMMALNANAQVYAYDSWAQLPTTDLYDTQTMNMALAHAEMRARVDT